MVLRSEGRQLPTAKPRSSLCSLGILSHWTTSPVKPYPRPAQGHGRQYGWAPGGSGLRKASWSSWKRMSDCCHSWGNGRQIVVTPGELRAKAGSLACDLGQGHDPFGLHSLSYKTRFPPQTSLIPRSVPREPWPWG